MRAAMSALVCARVEYALGILRDVDSPRPAGDVTCFSWIALKRHGEVCTSRHAIDAATDVVVSRYGGFSCTSLPRPNLPCRWHSVQGCAELRHDVVISRHNLVPRIESPRRVPVSLSLSLPRLPLSLPRVSFVHRTHEAYVYTWIRMYFQKSSSSKLDAYVISLESPSFINDKL